MLLFDVKNKRIFNVKNKRIFSFLAISVLLVLFISLSLFLGVSLMSARSYAEIYGSDTTLESDANAILPVNIRDMINWSISHAEDVFSVLFGQFYPNRKEFLLGTPALANLITERLQIITNPYYWKNYFREALIEGVFVIPTPFDPIKPELFLPTAKVEAGYNVSQLPVEYVDMESLTYAWKGERKTINDFMVTTETDCVVILHEGKIVYENYANGWEPGMMHQPWSATKAITSAMVGIAWGEERIDSVHDPIEKYITELEGTVWEGSTIENLLHMESGIYWDESIPVLAFNSQVQQWMFMLLDFLSHGLMGTTRNEFFKTLKRVNEPGTVFQYNSADTQVLAWLVETVYDTTFAEVVSEKLWKATGMESDALILTDRVGSAIASQSFFALPYDFARFGELFRNHGKNSYGRQVIPSVWVNNSVNFTDKSNGSYGYQWWNGSTDLFIYEASGFLGNKISVMPEDGVTAVRMSHHLGVDFRPNGDNPAKLSTYGFDIEMGEDEWQTMITAIAKQLKVKRY